MQYDAMTFPSMRNRWQTQPQRGELLGVSASVDGEMVGLAVAETWQEGTERHVELISLYVLPAYRQQPIEKQLHRHLQQAINHSAPSNMQ